MAHRNARLTPAGRRRLSQRIEAGTPIAHVAAATGISRQCASKWWHRWREFGPAGLEDRPCTPHRRARIAPRVEGRIVHLRRSRRWGPDRIAGYIGQSSTTVHRVLVRHRLNRLDHFDRQTGRVIRRYEAAAPRSVGAAGLLRALRRDLIPELRAEGFRRLRITGTRLAGAKRLVHERRAWADRRADDDRLHEDLEAEFRAEASGS